MKEGIAFEGRLKFIVTSFYSCNTFAVEYLPFKDAHVRIEFQHAVFKDIK